MGFSLFGSSGDKNTTNQTTNNQYDETTTVADSYNNTSNLSNQLTQNLAATLTKNSSYIKNDSNIQNTALQLTDAFNRLSNYNFANVGNVSIGATPAPPVTDYGSFFANAPQQKMAVTPVDLSKPLLDFSALSSIATANIKASGQQAAAVQAGFAQNTQASGAVTAGALQAMNSVDASSTMTKVLIGAIVLVVAFLGYMLVRRK